MDSFRKAYAALKDSTKVGLAKVNNSQFKELDIAIVKATNHDECPPKERHVKRIFAAGAASSPQADGGYCIFALSRRLWKTRSWIVAVKTLIVFHRLLREGEPSFRQQLVSISTRGTVFQISRFKDDSGPLAWDCSAWVRTYALFLEERIDSFMKLNYDIEGHRVPKSERETSNAKSKTVVTNPQQQLLDQLPSLQQLLYCLLCCQPEGAACSNFLIQYAFALVVKESFKVYCAINDKIIALLDKFFEMPKHNAIKALEIYKRAGRQADQLADFYAFCRTLQLAQTFQFPVLKQPPPSFLATMEEYIREAPRTGSATPKKLEWREKEEETQKPKEPNAEQVKKDETEQPLSLLGDEPEPVSEAKDVNAPPDSVQEPVDLLGFSEEDVESTHAEENNPLALAIVQSDNNALSTNNASSGVENSWELALITEPRNTSELQAQAEPSLELALITEPRNINELQALAEPTGGRFNRAFLNSLYEDDMTRKQLQMQSAGYATVQTQETCLTQSPFDQYNPFAMVPPMATMSPQQVYMQQQQQAAVATATNTTSFQQQQMMMMQQNLNYYQQNMMRMMAHPNPYAAAAAATSTQYGYSQPQHMPMPQVMPTNPFADDPFPIPHANNMPQNGNHMLF